LIFGMATMIHRTYEAAGSLVCFLDIMGLQLGAGCASQKEKKITDLRFHVYLVPGMVHILRLPTSRLARLGSTSCRLGPKKNDHVEALSTIAGCREIFAERFPRTGQPEPRHHQGSGKQVALKT
jgi:hypothetical protein